MSRRNEGSTVGWGLAQAAMLGIGVLTLYPLYFIVITAFKTRKEYLDNQFLPPTRPHPPELPRRVPRRAAADVGGQQPHHHGRQRAGRRDRVGAGRLPAGARTRFPGRLPFIGLNVVLMVVPPVVLVVPLFLFFVNLGLVNSRLAVVIIYVGLLIPFSIYLLVNFFATIPRSLEEAARIDGAGQLRTLWSVIVPLSAPAIMTIVVVNAVWVWNELLIALVFLQDDQARTLTAGLTFFQGRFIQNEPLVMTGALIATIPMLLLYIVGQRFFIRGLTAGFGK